MGLRSLMLLSNEAVHQRGNYPLHDHGRVPGLFATPFLLRSLTAVTVKG